MVTGVYSQKVFGCKPDASCWQEASGEMTSDLNTLSPQHSSLLNSSAEAPTPSVCIIDRRLSVKCGVYYAYESKAIFKSTCQMHHSKTNGEKKTSVRENMAHVQGVGIQGKVCIHFPSQFLSSSFVFSNCPERSSA